MAPGNIGVGLLAHAERAIAVVAGEEQEFKQGQARCGLELADHALAPSVGSRIIDGAAGFVLFARQEQLADQGQVFAERKAADQPSGRVQQGHAASTQGQPDLPDQARSSRVAQPPEPKLVFGLIGFGRDLRHGRTFGRAVRCVAPLRAGPAQARPSLLSGRPTETRPRCG